MSGTYLVDQFGNPISLNVQGAAVVTTSDAVNLPNVTRGIYLGASGDVKVTLNDGTTVTFTALSGGVIHPISAKRVWAAGTTATNILAVY